MTKPVKRWKHGGDSQAGHPVGSGSFGMSHKTAGWMFRSAVFEESWVEPERAYRARKRCDDFRTVKAGRKPVKGDMNSTPKLSIYGRKVLG